MPKEVFYLFIAFFTVLISSDEFLNSNPDCGCRENIELSKCGAIFGRINRKPKNIMFPCKLTYTVE